jgi:hypothetical protein
MGMLERIKKRQFQGFKEFVQNMEITPGATRQHIFMTGVLEDPLFMSYVMKNLRTFEDFLALSSDDIDTVLKHQDQILGIFAKCMFDSPEEKLKELESTIPRLLSKFKDEMSYLKEVTAQEKEAAKYYIIKTARKLQMDELIQGFRWELPPHEIFYPKTYKDGRAEIKFASGVMAAEGEITKGRRFGRWKHYYDSGKLLAEGEYQDGLKTSDWTFYYGNGSIKATGKYMLDLKEGFWEEYDRTGIKSEVEYVEGVKKDQSSSK